VIDLHCHVLPGLDDGPRTLEESIAVCRVAHREGTHTLVATPHVNSDYLAVTAAAMEDGVLALNRALRSAGLDLTVRTGAEVALSRVGELPDPELGRLALAGGPYVLLELPWTSAASGAISALRTFAHRGYRIVLAHPERSPMLQRHHEVVRELVDSGVLCCLDASSLTPRADRAARSMAWEMLAGRLVHVIASDCHDAVSRPPVLGSVLEQAGLNAAQIDYFAAEAPEAILSGVRPPPPPAVEAPHRRRWVPRRRR
jgi:protein-tyrosine phosphatase